MKFPMLHPFYHQARLLVDRVLIIPRIPKHPSSYPSPIVASHLLPASRQLQLNDVCTRPLVPPLPLMNILQELTYVKIYSIALCR